MERRSTHRAWDTYDAYLFDIDGTLLNCADAVHYYAFCSVLSELAGRPMNLDGIAAHGNTDSGIVRDALSRAGLSERMWRPHLVEVQRALCHYVAEHENELLVNTISGVEETLEHLHRRGALLGIVTGNLEQIGQMKLKHGGLLRWFEFGSYSDRCDGREEIVARGLLQVRELCRHDAAVCVVGDTPADVRAARSNALDVIAVATGIYSLETLIAEKPDICVKSLQELVPGVARSGDDSAPR